MSSSFQHNNPITHTTNAVSDVIDDTTSATTTTPMMIHAGTRVRIAGVVSQPTLNGREGCVVRVKNNVTTKMRDHTVERVLVAVDEPTKEEAQFVSVARAHVQPIRGNNDDVCRLLASKWSAETSQMTNN